MTALAALLLLAAGPLHPLDEAGFRGLLERHRGKVVLVNFWATWCEPCRTEMPALAALERKWRGRGLVLVTVSADDPEQEAGARAFLEKSGVPAPAFIKRAKSDEDFINAIDPKWSGALPALYLYGRGGEKVAGFIGETATADIEAAVAKAAR
ncbi:MAG: TlpA disulfide reductase family protein [Bryobacteraceae bacterium]